MNIRTDTTPRERLNGRKPGDTTIQPSADGIDSMVLYSPSEGEAREWENMEAKQSVHRLLLEPKKVRTGINRKFDSIMLGISSSVCFGLLAGIVIDLWAIPVGIIAGFYIAYKTNQREDY